MTSEREAMTLDRVRAEIALLKLCVLTPDDSQRIHDLLCAVEKDLSRAAEPTLQQALVALEKVALTGVTLHGDDISRTHAIADKLAPRNVEPVYQWRRKQNGEWRDGHIPAHIKLTKEVYEERILYTRPPEPARDAKRDQRMFIEGWRAAAEWANRWDLISDVDSPAWITRFDAAMAQESGE